MCGAASLRDVRALLQFIRAHKAAFNHDLSDERVEACCRATALVCRAIGAIARRRFGGGLRFVVTQTDLRLSVLRCQRGRSNGTGVQRSCTHGVGGKGNLGDCLSGCQLATACALLHAWSIRRCALRGSEGIVRFVRFVLRRDDWVIPYAALRVDSFADTPC